MIPPPGPPSSLASSTKTTTVALGLVALNVRHDGGVCARTTRRKTTHQKRTTVTGGIFSPGGGSEGDPAIHDALWHPTSARTVSKHGRAAWHSPQASRWRGRGRLRSVAPGARKSTASDFFAQGQLEGETNFTCASDCMA